MSNKIINFAAWAIAIHGTLGLVLARNAVCKQMMRHVGRSAVQDKIQ
jgi:hypothetical protein